MAIRRNKPKNRRAKRISFQRRTTKRKTRRKTGRSPSLIRIFKIMVMACISAGFGIGIIYALWFGFTYLDKYVKNNVTVREGTTTLKLIDVPMWVNEPLQKQIYTAAAPRGVLKPDENTASLIQKNLAQGTVWLTDAKVTTTHDSIQIEGKWRKPLALIKMGLSKWYVDSQMVVLDFVSLPNLPIVRIEGLKPTTNTPQPGSVWQPEDLAAAIAILAQLERMDKIVTPDKPLLYEIASIDVSNFKGHENNRFPHIVLYAKDNTEIIWGAEIDNWQPYLESTDEQKLAKLYEYYRQHGTLLGPVKYINLKDPQDNIPLPIDKYQ